MRAWVGQRGVQHRVAPSGTGGPRPGVPIPRKRFARGTQGHSEHSGQQVGQTLSFPFSWRHAAPRATSVTLRQPPLQHCPATRQSPPKRAKGEGGGLLVQNAPALTSDGVHRRAGGGGGRQAGCCGLGDTNSETGRRRVRPSQTAEHAKQANLFPGMLGWVARGAAGSGAGRAEAAAQG